MTWGALLSAVVGAVIALGSSLLADTRRDRQQRRKERQIDRRRHCVEFTVALVEAHGELRDVARRDPGDPGRASAANAAASGVYVAREQLLASGTPSLVIASETAFHRLVAVRDAVRAGATLDSAEYHDAYHPFAEALWGFRLAIRSDVGEPALTPTALGRADWTDRDRCETCRARTRSLDQ